MQRSLIGAAVLALAALSACDSPPTAGTPAEQPQELAAQVEALGFRGDMVQDFGSYVLIEGDIYMTREQLRRPGPPLSSGPLAPRFQYRTTALVGSPKVQQITVNLSGLASQSAWQTAARQALTHWSGISGSYVNMVEVTGSADISVSTACTTSTVAAYASFPSGGNPGSTVFVNTCFGYSTTSAQKLYVMVHEFGHTLGFRHSNYTQLGETAGTAGAVHVPGTPTSGNATGSVMNGATALTSWAGFASSDRLATRTLYPLPAPGAIGNGNVNGYPGIVWTNHPGVLYYTVRLREWEEYASIYGNPQILSDQTTVVGTTSGSPFVDTQNAYTGYSHCVLDQGYDFEHVRYFDYYVTATYANGTTVSGPVAAHMAQC